ncbi:hypothetical protein [Mycolicibacterium aromaticivorans]|uniref:hypothetical protein n=1 Tax=Mycolicibacterium aromaticivorans TaxID=318425 RepID=UPI000446EB06|nr:hypothetical protein [Mycolicibacterium aromaticivorans]
MSFEQARRAAAENRSNCRIRQPLMAGGADRPPTVEVPYAAAIPVLRTRTEDYQ